MYNPMEIDIDVRIICLPQNKKVLMAEAFLLAKVRNDQEAPN